MARVRRRHGGVELRASEAEAEALSGLVGDLVTMLDDDEEARRVDDGREGEEDPLAALVGISSGPVGLPADPAVARLFPDAYPDDEDRAAEYRRYTESDLRRGKRESAAVVRAALARLPQGRGRVQLDEEEVTALLGSLNDLRLVLGTRLQIDDDWVEQARDLDADDPRRDALGLYEALTTLQDQLVRSVLPGG